MRSRSPRLAGGTPSGRERPVASAHSVTRVNAMSSSSERGWPPPGRWPATGAQIARGPGRGRVDVYMALNMDGSAALPGTVSGYPEPHGGARRDPDEIGRCWAAEIGRASCRERGEV